MNPRGLLDSPPGVLAALVDLLDERDREQAERDRMERLKAGLRAKGRKR